ncbi:PREDICTED: LOW QUALITY PROTEIN: UPF0472 protein C16orf72 homolog [Branchiostoma belcheri]|uniref:LOW QUALITY PROTEIN: UPF0472 protein C16orf72 homolog n=1 Tax=Branchiostoma belcheri TaxID=7741 RepID=A0A6P5AEP6_BRABE|nr:PREDICTED: LOW QUALITY PROTEIN: UPF0472 protein C16orf72 homolog [Branchiostoma belcheri]
MADGGEDCSDWLRSWNQFEQQCVEEVEGEGNMEERLAGEREDVAQKLWLSFQNSATAVAQLYKDRGQGSHVWQVFQNAAQAVTLLYKDSIDANKRSEDFGIQCGYQRRTRDVVAWAKKRRRHIRREELLAFLCGKTVPSRTGSRSPPRSAPGEPRLGMLFVPSDRGQGSHVWQVFQNAAQAVTLLYKDSIDANKRSEDFGIQCGYQRRTRDVVAWAKKRRRHIRREELLAFLCGKTVPSRTGSRSPPRSARESPRLGSQEYAPSHQSEIDLQPFKDAIALQGLNGAMASFGLRTPTSPSHNMHSTPSRRRNLGELHAFISEEFANHMDSNSPNGRKRSSGNDLLGDSPVHKRSRHL